MREYVTFYLYETNPIFRSLPSRDKETKRKEIIKSADGRLRLREYLKRRAIPELNQIKKSALHIVRTDGFGKEQKSVLYAFPKLFETFEYQINDRKYSAYVTEKRIKFGLLHEAFHAFENVYGTNLGGGIVIGGSEYLDIHPAINNFLREAGGHMLEIEQSRMAEKPDIMHLARAEFDKLANQAPSYFSALISFIQYVDEISPALKPSTLSSSELRYVRLQLSHMKRKLPELIGSRAVQELYRRFGV